MKKFIIASVAAVMALTACVKDGMYPLAAISDLSNTVAYYETDDVTVTATVTSFVDITGVNLIYTTGSAAAKTVAMKASGKTYSGTIPAAPLGTEVKFHVEATTEGGTVSSSTVTYKVGEVPIDYTKLKLNELNGNDKFIELYNAGTENITLKDVHVYKDSKDVWTGPARVLGPGEFVLLYSEDVVIAGGAQEGYDSELVFGSGLSAKKAVKVQLVDPKGNDIDVFNLVTLAKTAPASYSRVPDGSGTWCYTSATPGAKNATDNSDPVTGLE